MRTIEEIRHARLIQLLELPEYPTVQSLADKIERVNAQVSQWKNRSERKNKAGKVTGLSNIDSVSARWIEKKVGKPPGWMDNDPKFDVPETSDAATDHAPAGSNLREVKAARNSNPPSNPMNAEEVIVRLGTLLAEVPRSTRRGALGLLSGLEDDPASAASLGRQLAAMLDAAKDKAA